MAPRRGSSRSRSPPSSRNQTQGYDSRSSTDGGYGGGYRPQPAPQPAPHSFGGSSGGGGGGGFGGLIDTKALIAAAMANAASSSQSGIINPATRTARRLYVGGLPVTTEPQLVCSVAASEHRTAYIYVCVYLCSSRFSTSYLRRCTSLESTLWGCTSTLTSDSPLPSLRCAPNH